MGRMDYSAIVTRLSPATTARPGALRRLTRFLTALHARLVTLRNCMNLSSDLFAVPYRYADQSARSVRREPGASPKRSLWGVCARTSDYA